jgi:peptidoglycan-associated lipoprotein
MKKQLSVLSLFSILAAAFVLTGCPPKKKLQIDSKATEEKPFNENVADAANLAPGDFRINQDWTDVPALSAVVFEYNSAAIDEAARNVLKENVKILKKLPKSVSVRVEGHCDDRGTIEYNFALGQRRASAVRSYYVTSGLDKARVETISYGEERPLCAEQTDACWAQNRRSATKLKNKEAITIKSTDLDASAR